MEGQGQGQGAQVYAAQRLQLENIPGVVTVRVGRAAGITVDVKGTERMRKRITVSESGGTLYVRGPRRGSGSISIVSGRNFTNVRGASVVRGVTIVGGAVHIDGAGGDVYVGGQRVTPGGGSGESDESSRVNVTVNVPPGTAVRIEESGECRYYIGDTDGELAARLMGSVEVSAGRVTSASVHVSGQATVGLDSVVGGSLFVKLSGQGSVKVKGGRVEHLDVGVSGQGDVGYGGTAKRATLKVSGMGDIRVNQVTERVEDRCTGMGQIYVHSRPQGNPDTFRL